MCLRGATRNSSKAKAAEDPAAGELMTNTDNTFNLLIELVNSEKLLLITIMIFYSPSLD